MNEYRVAGGASLPCGRMKSVLVDGTPVCVVHVDDGAFFALDDTCSHGQSSLSKGYLEGRKLECAMHGSLFDVTTGVPITLPATVPVRTFAVAIDGDDLLLSPNPADRS